MLQAYNAIIINNKKIICSKQKIKLGILISKSKSTFPFPGCVFCIRRHCIFSISHLLLLLQHPFFALHILRYFHLLPWPVSLRHANLKFKIEIKRNLKSEWIFFKRVFNIFFLNRRWCGLTVCFSSSSLSSPSLQASPSTPFAFGSEDIRDVEPQVRTR